LSITAGNAYSWIGMSKKRADKQEAHLLSYVISYLNEVMLSIAAGNAYSWIGMSKKRADKQEAHLLSYVISTVTYRTTCYT